MWTFKEKWSKKTNLALENTGTFKSKIDWRLFRPARNWKSAMFLSAHFPFRTTRRIGCVHHIRTPAGNIGFATDLGHVTKLVMERIRSANVLVLESNHDVKMLAGLSRSWALKQRILGRHGHISNVTAAETVAQIMSAGLRQLYLAHLSRECNTPELAQHIMAEQLHQIGAKHVQLHVAGQDVPCPTLGL